MMQAWMIKTAFRYALPYLVEWIFTELLGRDVKDKVKKKKPLTPDDIKRVIHSYDRER